MLNIKVQRLKCYRNKKIKTEKLRCNNHFTGNLLDNLSSGRIVRIFFKDLTELWP